MEEEDVILKNSPLYKYLEQVGCIDTDVDEVPADSKHESKHSASSERKSVPYMQSLKRWWWSHLYPIREVEKMNEYYRSRCYNRCIQSGLILEDDQKFLSSYLDSYLSENKDYTNSSSVDLSMKNGMCFILLMFPLYQWWRCAGCFSQLLSITAGIIGTCLMTVRLVRRYFVRKSRRSYERNTKLVEDVIDGGIQLSRCMKKSVRLIQESEIIMRGFTLVTIKDAITRIEKNSLQSDGNSINNQFHQCVPLRRQIFTVANNLFLDIRELTLELIESVPLSGDIDNISTYLAGVPLDQFEISDELTDDQHERNKTLAVSNLKFILERYFLQQSEFLSRLILIYYPECATSSTDNTHDFIRSNITQSSVTLQSLLEMNKEAFGKTSKSFHFHKCLLNGEPSSSVVIHVEKKDNKVHTSIHSLYLHLQVALARVREFEDLLETMEKQPVRSAESCVHVSSMLNQVMAELRLCSDCVEETFVFMNRDSSCKTSNRNVIDDVKCLSSNQCTSVTPWTRSEEIIGDPRIEEQVYEAYVERCEDGFKRMNYDELTQHMIMKKQEAEDAARLYRELKSVLKLRAADVQEKEDDALNYLRNAIETTNSSDEQTRLNNGRIDSETSDKDGDREYKRRDGDGNDVRESGFAFAANVATLAAARSRSLGLSSAEGIEILGDSSDSD